jgi:hypothetical protein
VVTPLVVIVTVILDAPPVPACAIWVFIKSIPVVL